MPHVARCDMDGRRCHLVSFVVDARCLEARQVEGILCHSSSSCSSSRSRPILGGSGGGGRRELYINPINVRGGGEEEDLDDGQAPLWDINRDGSIGRRFGDGEWHLPHTKALAGRVVNERYPCKVVVHTLRLAEIHRHCHLPRRRHELGVCPLVKRREGFEADEGGGGRGGGRGGGG